MDEDTQPTPGILVIRLSAIGDVANTLPAVCALRRTLPEARITWLAEQGAAELVALAGVADEIVVFPRKRLAHLSKRPWRWGRALTEARNFLRKLRAGEHEYALDFQGNLKSGVLGLFSGARERIGFARGFCREMNWLLNNIQAAPRDKRLPRAEKNAALAQVLAPELELQPVPLRGSAEDASSVEEFLRGLLGDGPLVVLHPGTSAFGRFKRWPADRFGQLAAELKGARGARCVVTRGPDEDAIAEQVAAASAGAASIAPPFSFGPLVELLRRAQLVIAGDTGPLHVAAVMDRPVVAIFGPKDPVVYRPYSDRCAIVRKDLECSPCTRRQCDHVRCILEITVADVLTAAEDMLGQPNP